MHSFYIAIDGDDVGRKLEYFVVTNQTQKLSNFSKNYHKTMVWLEKIIKEKLGVEVIFSGGDSLLALYTGEQSTILSELETLRSEFAKMTEITLSVGIGVSPRQAYFALKLAKAKGKGRIELFEEYSNEQR